MNLAKSVEITSFFFWDYRHKLKYIDLSRMPYEFEFRSIEELEAYGKAEDLQNKFSVIYKYLVIGTDNRSLALAICRYPVFSNNKELTVEDFNSKELNLTDFIHGTKLKVITKFDTSVLDNIWKLRLIESRNTHQVRASKQFWSSKQAFTFWASYCRGEIKILHYGCVPIRFMSQLKERGHIYIVPYGQKLIAMFVSQNGSWTLSDDTLTLADVETEEVSYSSKWVEEIIKPYTKPIKNPMYKKETGQPRYIQEIVTKAGRYVTVESDRYKAIRIIIEIDYEIIEKSAASLI